MSLRPSLPVTGAPGHLPRSWLSKMAPRPPRARQMLTEAPAAPQHGRGRAGPGGAGQGEEWHRRVQQGMPVVRGMAGAARPCPPRLPRCERPRPPGDAGERRSQPQGLRGINKHVKNTERGRRGSIAPCEASQGPPPHPRCNVIPLFIPAAPGLVLAPKPPRERRGVAGGERGRARGPQPHSSVGQTRAGRRGRSGHGRRWRCPCPAARDRWTRCRPPRARSLPALLHRELRNPAR